MSTRGVMKLLPAVQFYIYITKLSAKSVSLLKEMIIESAANALQHVIHAWSDETDTLDGPKLDSTTHANEEWLEK